jgi:hypothetical protein
MLFIFSILLLSCNDKNIVGNGDVVTESRSITEFNSVKVEGDFVIHLQQGNNCNVFLKMDKNLLNNTVTNIEGDVLHIKSVLNVLHYSSNDIYIIASKLRHVDLIGNNVVDCVNSINVSSFDINSIGLTELNLKVHANFVSLKLEGSSIINISGVSNRLNVDMLGLGSLNTLSLFSKSVVLNLNGMVSSKVFVSEYFDVDVDGAGVVEYKGNPEIIKEISKNVKFNKLE